MADLIQSGSDTGNHARVIKGGMYGGDDFKVLGGHG